MILFNRIYHLTNVLDKNYLVGDHYNLDTLLNPLHLFDMLQRIVTFECSQEHLPTHKTVQDKPLFI